MEILFISACTTITLCGISGASPRAAMKKSTHRPNRQRAPHPPMAPAPNRPPPARLVQRAKIILQAAQGAPNSKSPRPLGRPWPPWQWIRRWRQKRGPHVAARLADLPRRAHPPSSPRSPVPDHGPGLRGSRPLPAAHHPLDDPRTPRPTGPRTPSSPPSRCGRWAGCWTKAHLQPTAPATGSTPRPTRRKSPKSR